MSVLARSVLVFGRRIPVLAILAGLLVIGGVLSVIIALSNQRNPPRPSAQAATAPIGPTGATASPHSLSPRRPAMGPGRHSGPVAIPPPAGPHTSLPPGDGQLRLSGSDPVRLRIPAIGVSSSLLQLGLKADHSVEVPPLSQVGTAGWYKYSAPPGVAGSTVVLGHVDSAAAPGVFFRLVSLQPGDEVDVARADGSTAVFRVDGVKEFSKSAFPSKLVYYPTSYPSLKLVTCGGQFDAATGNYLDNIVAFTTLVAVHG